MASWFEENDYPSYMMPVAPPPPEYLSAEATARAQISQAYRDFLGREASPEEVNHWISKGGFEGNSTVGLYQSLLAIKNSPEAQEYLKKKQAEPAAAATSPMAPSTAGRNTNPDEFGRLWLASGGRTVDDLKKFIAEHPEFGATTGGSKGDKVTIGGRTFDAILAAGEGGKGATWDDITSGGGSSSSFGKASFNDIAPFSYAPYSGPAYTPPPEFSYQPWDQKFVAPTGLDMQNDPGYMERLRLGTDALQGSAAARGTLLTTGTLKDLNQYAQDYASSEYGNVYNRAADQYNKAYQAYLGNYGQALDIYNTNYAGNLQNYNTARAGYQQDYQNALSAYGANLNAQGQFFNQDLAANNQNWNQQFGLATLGSNNFNAQANREIDWANLVSRNNFAGAGGYTENLTGGANANAAGVIGAGGSGVGSALTTVANYAPYYTYMYGSGYNRPTSGTGTTPSPYGGGGSSPLTGANAYNPYTYFPGWSNNLPYDPRFG